MNLTEKVARAMFDDQYICDEPSREQAWLDLKPFWIRRAKLAAAIVLEEAAQEVQKYLGAGPGASVAAVIRNLA